MIENFITHIQIEDYYDENFEFQQRYVFDGDGVGDFEKHRQLLNNPQLIKDYISHCRGQIQFAEDYLNDLEEDENYEFKTNV